MELNIYKLNEGINACIAKIRKADMPDINKQKILEFSSCLQANGYSKQRIMKYLQLLYVLGKKISKDFISMKRKDIELLMSNINSSAYSEWTKHDYKVAVKFFFRWLYYDKLDGSYPDVVDWIKATKSNNHMLPEDLLDHSDIKKLINSALNPRDKAIIGCLYESSTRVGEILTLQIKNVTFDNDGAILKVKGKTGERRIRIVMYAPLLQRWIEVHPKGNDREAPVWIGLGNHTNTILNYPGIRTMLQKCAARAKITKKVNPHKFRHSRASFLAKHFTEAQMKEYHGWKQGSSMAAIYVHLSGRDVDDAVLNLYGKQEKKPESILLAPIRCERCHTFNEPSAQRCSQCRWPFTEEARIEDMKKDQLIYQLIKRLSENESMKKCMQELMDETGIGNDLEKLT